MRRRILFVDDDPGIREWLQHALDPDLSAWEVHFARNAEEALDSMGCSRVDVLVTDLAMPGMSGVELLQRAAELHPAVVRVVLTTPSGQPLVFPCSTLVHQCIFRPCETEVLREAIARALELHHSVRRERIAALAGRMDCLPSVPDLYLQLVEKIQDPQCSSEEIARIIAQDISMTARLLKLVNSAFFGLRRRVSSPHEAINYVGLDTVRALVLSISAFAHFEHLELGGLLLEPLWNHSLLAAGQARTIALAERASPREADDAFVSGLLHDLGRLALSANFPAVYRQLIANGGDPTLSPLDAETRAFGVDHAELGGHLLAIWDLPETVAEAVAWHHDPSGCPRQEFGALACTHAAEVWSQEGAGNGSLKLAVDYYERIGCEHRIPAWRQACCGPEARASA